MKKIFIGIISFILALSLFIPMNTLKAEAKAYDANSEYSKLNLRFWNDEKPNQRFYINAASRYILETVKEPKMGSTYGEWSVMDLLRGMYTGSDYINYIPADYFTKYVDGINTYVTNKNGELDRNKSTEWSRLTLSMSALGIPITNIAGYDFVDRLAQSYKFSYRQGINGPIWEIIALNTAGYEFPITPSKSAAGDINTVGKMIDFIIGKEITTTAGVTGGWSLPGKVADPDITGMALQALAPYYVDETKYPKTSINTSYVEFKKSVERGILAMSAMQQPGGGFNAWGNVNAESTTQVIVALTALNIDPKTKSVALPTIGETALFNQQAGMNDGVTTDNMIDMLLSFFAEGSGSSPEVSGFKHITSGYDGGGGSGTGVNDMATDQALYGLIAYDRFLQKQKPLYDMTDQSAGQYKSMVAKKINVKLETNGQVSTQIKSPYATLKIPTSSPTSNEKVVTWNSKVDGTGAIYLPNELLVIPEQDITLYAQFGENTYNINYELNGGTFNKTVTDRYKATEETKLPTTQDIKRDGYTFVGWYDNAQFTGGTVTSIAKGSNKNKQFYAKWVDQNSLAKELNDLIVTLPTTIAEKDTQTIQTIRSAYNNLSVADQVKVVNYGKLLDAEYQLQVIQSGNTGNFSDEELAVKMMEIINELPEGNAITLQHQSTITKARALYNTLNVKQKMNISNYSLLLKAEKAFAALESVEIDAAVARQIEQTIKELPSVSKLSLKDEEQLEMARTAYDVISFKQQKKVLNYNALVQAELQLERLKNDAKLKVNAVKNNSSRVSGTTSQNTTVTAFVSGEKLSSTKSNTSGRFTLQIKKQKAGTKLVVKTSEASKTITVTPWKVLPTPKVSAVGAKSIVITGTAEKYTTITAKVSGKTIGTARVTSKGTYAIKIKPQKKSSKIVLTIKDSMNSVSNGRIVSVSASKTLTSPKVNKVTSKTTTMTGKASKSTIITLYSNNGTKLTSAKVSSKGNFSLKMKKYKKNTVLKIQTKDGLNNTSKLIKVTVK